MEELDIQEIVKSGANVQLVINALDLREAFLQWSEECGQKKQQEEERYLTEKETTEMLDVDASTLWRWNKSGYLKKVKLGNRAYWRLSDIKKLMEE